MHPEFPPDTQAAQRAGRWGRIPAWWLSHPEIDADGLAVLAALSTYVNNAGECWPSQSTLAEGLKRSRSTVNRILGHLAAAAVIEVEPRRSANGGRLSCLYRLRLEPGNGPIANVGTTTVRQRHTDVATADSPCAGARQEHPESEQIPDSLAERRRDGGIDDRAEEQARQEQTAQPVPVGWMPPAADLAWAHANYGMIDLAGHVEGFVLRCTAHGYRYRDAGAAWRAWLVQDAAARKAPLLPGSPAAMGTPRATDKAAAARQQVAIWAGVADRVRRQQSGGAGPSLSGGGF